MATTDELLALQVAHPLAAILLRRPPGGGPETLVIDYANDAADEQSVMPMRPHIGKRVFEVFEPLAEAHEFHRFWMTALETGEQTRLDDIPYDDPRFERAWYTLHGIPLSDTCLAVVYENTTEQVRARAIAEERLATIKQSNRDLERFAHFVSHDLRAPLRAVRGFAELAMTESGELPEAVRTYLTYVVDRAADMQRMIDAILDLSRVQSGPVDEVAELDAIARGAWDDASADATELDDDALTLEPLPAVRASREQLRLLFTNVFRNAIAYRSEAPLRVQVAASRDRQQWRVSVRDNGAGLEPGTEATVFEMFQRGTSSDPTTGHGIGLALCQRIVEQHGGRMWAECLDRGTAFHFTLPVAGA